VICGGRDFSKLSGSITGSRGFLGRATVADSGDKFQGSWAWQFQRTKATFLAVM